MMVVRKMIKRKIMVNKIGQPSGLRITVLTGNIIIKVYWNKLV